MSARDNLRIGQAWFDAFAARDVEALLGLYADDCRHSSPKIRALHPQTGGQLLGKEALKRWWQDALERLPTLRYEPLALTADDRGVWLEYLRHVAAEPAMPVAEVLEIRDGRIVASRVYHG